MSITNYVNINIVIIYSKNIYKMLTITLRYFLCKKNYVISNQNI